MAKLKLNKCKPEMVRQMLEALGLDHDGSVKATAERLQKFYSDSTGFDIAGCDVCDGDSDASLDNCPFCGEEGVLEPEQQQLPNTKAPAKATKANVPAAKAAMSKTAKAAKARTAKAAKAKADKAAKAKDDNRPPPTRSKKKVATKATKDAPKTGGKTTATKAKKTTKKAAPKVNTEVASAEIITVKELDAQVDIIRRCVTEGAIALHRLGVASKTISEAGLWKMRTTKDGKSLYRNFKQFCSEDLGMTAQHIYRAIGVADEFSEDEVRGLSGNQIRVVMQLPKDVRGDALTAAQGGEGTSALSARAAQLKGDKGTEAPPPDKAITVAMVMGIQKVPMYKRPKKPGKVGDTEGATPATSLADKPWLAIELKNKVRMLVRIDHKKDGTLQATIEHRRGEQVI